MRAREREHTTHNLRYRARETREAKTEGGAQKYTQDIDDTTAREGGTETGM
jgi:hypothetical protein